MNGTEAFEKNWENKIQNKLKKYPFLKGYVNYLHGTGSTTTNYNYLNHIVRFLEYCDKNINQIDFDDYVGYLNFLRTKTNGYQRCAYFALKRFSEYLVLAGKIDKDYMQNIKPVKDVESIKTKTKREKAFLTKEEVSITLKNVVTPNVDHNIMMRRRKWMKRDYAILYVFLSTGIRCSALQKLDLNNINWEESTLIVIDKGSKVHKYILPSKTLEVLSDWIKIRESILGDKKEDALFISNQKHRISNETITQIVKKYTTNIEGKNITPHKLRATFGTHLYNETRDIKFVQDQMGHSNPKTTELYVRGNQDTDRQKAADIMSKFLE